MRRVIALVGQSRIWPLGLRPNLTMDTILLICESEGRESGRLELSNGGCAKIKTALTKKELYIFEAERGAVSRAVSVFPWA